MLKTWKNAMKQCEGILSVPSNFCALVKTLCEDHDALASWTSRIVPEQLDPLASKNLTKVYRKFMPDDRRSHTMVKVFRHPDAPPVNEPLLDEQHAPLAIVVHLLPDLPPMYAHNIPLWHALGTMSLMSQDLAQQAILATQKLSLIHASEHAQPPYLHALVFQSMTLYLGRDDMPEPYSLQNVLPPPGGDVLNPFFHFFDLRHCSPDPVSEKLLSIYDTMTSTSSDS